MSLLDKAVNRDSEEAMAEVGNMKLHGKFYPTNHRAASRLFRKAMAKNVFSVKESLATCYQFGIGVDVDHVQAFQFYNEAFHGGIPFCTVHLANCYDLGIGVKQDPKEATKIYKKCMDRGAWEREFVGGYYGLRMVCGHGIQKSVTRGKEIIFESTKSDSSYGGYALGECYRYGLGVSKDKEKARKLYLKAVRSGKGVVGVVDSYLALASMFENGEGFHVNISLAHKYYMEAANRLSPEAQWKVALALESGVGMHENIQRSVFYFRCAQIAATTGLSENILHTT